MTTRLLSLLATAYALVQVAVPASYYLGRDRWDERFAWRMFSSRVELFHCEPEYHERRVGARDDEWSPQPLAVHFRKLWMGFIKEGHPRVAAAMLEHRCHAVGLESVRLTLRCHDGATRLPVDRTFVRRCGSPTNQSASPWVAR